MAKRSRHDFFDEEFLARLQRLHLIAKRMAARGSAGPRRSRRMGDGLEFADHRAYAPGDDIRFIDWPYYARMERLLLRLFHEHSESDVAILLDVSGSMATDGPPGGVPAGQPAKYNYARRAAAALAYVAMGSLERVILLPFAAGLGEPMRTGRNRAQILDVLDFLSALQPGGETHLRGSVEEFARRYRSAGTVIILSDLLDCSADLSDALARLQVQDFDVTVLHLYTPADASPLLRGPMLLHQVETAQRISMNVTEELLESYRLRWREFQAGCERTCVSRGATYVAAETSVPFERLVLQALRQAGVLSG